MAHSISFENKYSVMSTFISQKESFNFNSLAFTGQIGSFIFIRLQRSFNFTKASIKMVRGEEKPFQLVFYFSAIVLET